MVLHGPHFNYEKCFYQNFQVAKEAAPENPEIWTDEDNEIEFTIPKRTPKKTPKKQPEPTSDDAIFAVSKILFFLLA